MPDSHCRGHDHGSLFDELYAAHSQALHAYFLGRTGDAELALDLLQDTFIRVWRSLVSIDGLSPERQRAWLFTIARNIVIDQYRARATRQATRDALRAEASVGQPSAPPADVELVAHERMHALDDAIRGLPEDLRIVLVLQVVGDKTSTEIGELLGRPPGTVRYQLALARRQLARQLGVMDG